MLSHRHFPGAMFLRSTYECKKVVSHLGVVGGPYTMYLQAVSERLIMLWEQLYTATQNPLSATWYVYVLGRRYDSAVQPATSAMLSV